jgi:organic hydroperoxide reductase OsmC/OhrA
MKHERTHIFENIVFQNTNKPAKAVFNDPGEIEIGPAAEFGGSGQTLNPEEMFIAAINSCLINTFFYFTQKFNIELLSYYSQAQGQLEKQSDGFRFTNIKVRARVEPLETKAAEEVHEASQLTERYCLVSHSVACPIDYQLQVEINGK